MIETRKQRRGKYYIVVKNFEVEQEFHIWTSNIYYMR